MELEKSITRKVEQRKYARAGLGQDELLDTDSMMERMESYRELSDHIADAQETAHQDGYFALISKNGLPGKCVVFVKKAMRKLLKMMFGWYIFPILDRQTDYNESIAEASELLKEIIAEQQEELESYKAEQLKRKEQLDYIGKTLNISWEKMEQEKKRAEAEGVKKA